MTQSGCVSLEEFAEQRRSQRRQVTVFVEGDPGQEPPKGRATACRVAHIIQSGEGSIIDVGEDDVDLDSLAENSVLIVTATSDDEEVWAELRKLETAPFQSNIHIVVHSDEIPEYALRLVDIRVVDDEGIESIGRIQVDGYDGEVYEIEMGGLT